MTGVYLSECFHELPAGQLKRIQILLRIILRSHSGRDKLKRTLRSVFQELGRPLELLNSMRLETRLAFLKLLENFGTLAGMRLSSGEKEALLELPFVLRLENGTYVIYGEALEYFASDSYFRNQGYLFSHVKNLGLREKRAWLCWLNGDEARPEYAAAGVKSLYRRLAVARFEKSPPGNEESAEELFPDSEAPDRTLYMDEIFPNDPMETPVAWFYRGVLPLYDALSDAEKAIHRESLLPKPGKRAREVIRLLKTGDLIARRVAAEFGKPERYALIPSRENISFRDFPSLNPLGVPADKKENLLF